MSKLLKIILLTCLFILISLGIYYANYWNLIPKRYYFAEKFGIEEIHSSVDFNNNGIDDYTDIL